MQFKKECVNITRNKIIVFEERRSKLAINNNDEKELSKVIIDGCQITEGIRCDNMLIESEKENYIELKGHDIGHAINQIKKTIELCSKDKQKYSKRCFIICTRSPLSAASIQNHSLVFKRDFNAELIIKSSPYSYNI